MHSLIKGMIAAPLMLLALSACEQNPESPMVDAMGSVDSDLSAQQLFDRGKVVCKDGYAYLFGYAGGSDGGPWVTPYMRDGKQGKCVTPEQQKSTVEFEGV